MKLAFTVATPDTHDPGMAAFRGDLHSGFGTLAEIGYDAVELMVRNPAELHAGELRKLAERSGLRIPAVSTGQLRKEDNLSLNATEPSRRALAVQRTREVIDFAAEFGAQVNIGTLRGQMPTGPQRALAIAAARESLEQLVTYASAKAVRLALEPQCRYVCNWLNTVDEVREYITSFGSVHPWMLFDVYHAMLEERSVAAAMIRVRDLMTWVQFSDSNRLAPGTGQMHFGEHIRVLRALGYEGYVSVECLPVPSAEAAARQARQHLIPLLEEA